MRHFTKEVLQAMNSTPSAVRDDSDQTGAVHLLFGPGH
jgi:hypothetical protein